MSPELMYANGAAAILKQRGEVWLGYITAGLEPYSAQQKPDISFRPDDGPNAGRMFFVELRLFDSDRFPQHFPKALREHREFAIDGADCEYAGFAFATNVSLQPEPIGRLAESGIRYLGPVNSPEMLAEKISAWAWAPSERVVNGSI